MGGDLLYVSIHNSKARRKCTQIVVTLIPPFFAGRRFFDWGSSSSSRFRPCSFPSLGPPDTGGFDMVKKLSGSRGTFSFQETAPSRNTNLAWRYSVGGIFYRVFQYRGLTRILRSTPCSLPQAGKRTERGCRRYILPCGGYAIEVSTATRAS